MNLPHTKHQIPNTKYFQKAVSYTKYQIPNTKYLLIDLITFIITAFLRYATYPYLFQKASYKINQRGVIKLTKQAITTYLIIFFAFSSVAGLFLFNPFGADEADAAWFNDNWALRKRIDVTITSTGSDITNLDTLLTVDTTGITANLQTNCEDLRFTNTNGDLLPYFIDSCNDNSATNKIWVRANLVPKSTTIYTIYMYYGNPGATAASNSAAFNLYNGLERYYTMNESSWTNNCSTGTVVDSSANGDNGTSCPNGTGSTTPVSAQYANGGAFDGSNDYVNSTYTTHDSVFTASIWVYADVVTGGGRTYLSKNSYTGSNNGFFLRQFDTTLQAGIQNSGTDYTVNGSISATTWTHVAMTFDGTTLKLYKNGALVGSRSDGAYGSNAQPFKLGAGYHGDSEFFDGTLDDARYYNRVLSDSEILQLYTTPGSITTTATATSKPSTSFATEEKGPAPTMYWKFDQGQGTTAEDTTSNSLDGTLNNTPTWQTENMCIAGLCLYFDGSSNENVSIADDAKLDFAASDNFTLGAWVKRNSASSANTVIMQKSGANISSTYTGYKLYMDASGDLCFDIQDGTNAVDSACTSAVDFDDDAWHFVEGVKAATTSITLYVDGKQRAQDASIASTGTLANASTFRVGIDSDGLANDWLGFIDEVKVTRDQTARTAAQVAADYNARSNPEGVSQQQGTNTQNMPAALSNGLISYWKMDEAAANTCTGGVNDSCDSSGNAKNAPWTGNIAATTGKFGNAITLDGTGDYISMGADATYNLAANYSFCSWFKTSTADKDIITNGTSSTGHYLLQVDGDGKLKAHSWTSSSNNAITSTTTVTGGSWTHGCQIVDSTDISVYVNGVKENSAVIVGTRGGQTGTFTIGARGGGVSHEWNGQLDEIRVYNRALSPPEVSSLYNWAPGPVGYWKLDEKTGQSVIDSSGNGYSGDLGATSGSESTDPEWTQGKFGGGIQITASDTDRTTIAHNAALNPSAITIVSWVKRVNLASSGNIVSKRSNEGYRFRSDGSGLIEWFDRGGVNNISSGSNTIPSNQWAHVAVTGSASGLKIYINGVLANSNAVAYGAGATTGSLFFGGDPGGVGEHFNGGIDDVKIYSYERTAAQIIEDMNAGHPAPGSPVSTPVGFWKFNEGADNTCSGGTNDACNSGAGGTTFDGTSTATRTNSGKLSRALDFDGTDDVVTITNASGIDFNENLANFTFSSWIYADSDGEADTGQIFNKGASTYFRVDTQGTTDLDLECNLDLATTDANVNVTDGLTTAAWNHVACSWNGTTMSIYINGLLRGSSSSGSGAISADANNLLIGGPTTANFDGKIDEFKVYNSALTASQMALDANAASAQVLGATGNNSTAGAVSAESQEYCIPGDSTTCTVPVGRWDFEEGSGTTVYDTSGNANTGTLTAGTGGYTRGKLGKGYNYDGASTVAFEGSGTTLDNLPAAGMTIEAWIYPRTIGENNAGFIVAKNNGTSQNAGWILLMIGTNTLQFVVDGSTDLVRTSSNNSFSLNTWSHVALSWDGVITTASTADIYVNGAEVSYQTTTNGAARVDDAASSFYIGNDSSSARTFDGVIDNVRAFNYSRTATQIAYDYNRGAPVAHWKMDECQGTTINDSAGNSVTGTWSGSGGTYTSPGTCSVSSASSAWYNGAVGKRNYSLAFDGSDDIVDFGTPTKLNLPDSVGMAVWVKPDSTALGANYHAMIGNYDGGGTTAQYEFAFKDGNLNYNYGASSSYVEYTPTSSISFSAGTWYHIVFTHSGSNSTGYFYVNGVKYATNRTGSVTIPTSGFSNSTIGRGGPSGDYFSGQIDDFKIFNYTLNDTLVKTLYNQGAANYGPVTGAP